MIKKIATWRKKSIDDPKKESITADHEEDSITEDPKENPINEKPKEDTLTATLLNNSIDEDPQEFQDPQ